MHSTYDLAPGVHRHCINQGTHRFDAVELHRKIRLVLGQELFLAKVFSLDRDDLLQAGSHEKVASQELDLDPANPRLVQPAAPVQTTTQVLQRLFAVPNVVAPRKGP